MQKLDCDDDEPAEVLSYRVPHATIAKLRRAIPDARERREWLREWLYIGVARLTRPKRNGRTKR